MDEYNLKFATAIALSTEASVQTRNRIRIALMYRDLPAEVRACLVEADEAIATQDKIIRQLGEMNMEILDTIETLAKKYAEN